MANANGPTPSFVVDEAGDYVAELAVSDGTTSTLASVLISTVNTSPVAHAGAEQYVAVGSTVQLDGSGSTEADSDPLTYLWTFVSVPAGSQAALSNATSVEPTFVADVAGVYELKLTVQDAHGNNASDRVQISTEDTPPVANAGAEQQVPVGNRRRWTAAAR